MKNLQVQQVISWLVLTALWSAALLVAVVIGGGVLLLAATSSLPFPLVATLLVGTALLAIFRQQSRDRARRHRAALDAFVARELTRLALHGRNHRFGLAPVSVPVDHEH